MVDHFQDAQLNALEEQVNVSNQNLKAADGAVPASASRSALLSRQTTIQL